MNAALKKPQSFLPVSEDRLWYNHEWEGVGPVGRFPGCNQGRQELSSDYLLFATFLVTHEDAKAYLYSMSNKRRVHKWKDSWVNLYI